MEKISVLNVENLRDNRVEGKLIFFFTRKLLTRHPFVIWYEFEHLSTNVMDVIFKCVVKNIPLLNSLNFR